MFPKALLCLMGLMLVFLAACSGSPPSYSQPSSDNSPIGEIYNESMTEMAIPEGTHQWGAGLFGECLWERKNFEWVAVGYCRTWVAQNVFNVHSVGEEDQPIVQVDLRDPEFVVFYDFKSGVRWRESLYTGEITFLYMNQWWRFEELEAIARSQQNQSSSNSQQQPQNSNTVTLTQQDVENWKAYWDNRAATILLAPACASSAWGCER